jgi:hypothetical protein
VETIQNLRRLIRLRSPDILSGLEFSRFPSCFGLSGRVAKAAPYPRTLMTVFGVPGSGHDR